MKYLLRKCEICFAYDGTNFISLSAKQKISQSVRIISYCVSNITLPNISISIALALYMSDYDLLACLAHS